MCKDDNLPDIDISYFYTKVNHVLYTDPEPEIRSLCRLVDSLLASAGPNPQSKGKKALTSSLDVPTKARDAITNVKLIHCKNTASRFSLGMDLDNKIHPIFARPKWSITDEDFAKLQPAVQLASLFLDPKMKSVRDFLSHIATGDIVLDSNGGPYISSHGTPNTTQAEDDIVDGMLESMKQKVDIEFTNISRPTSTLGPNSIPPVAYFRASADDRLQIRLSSEFLDFLRHTERITVLFKITVALLHELAHVFYHVRFGHNAESAITEGCIPEMGYAIEYFLFGILCEPNFSPHQDIFFAAELEEENFTWKDRATGDYVAPGSWAKNWFFKHTWDRI
ncbi:hypothetical protein BS50DRAFT_640942 [Corynespora cassiicola Philippines]|uniref:Uncharacterized protein n=1 Tax=Corynespora cassiicola Philippines TaxID=1448308 RepID=A0A2T2N1Z5_CORCC|nr:hypothetical protein BS50DRAFT_640942 [Corynespora cassiicola Philippines]